MRSRFGYFLSVYALFLGGLFAVRTAIAQTTLLGNFGGPVGYGTQCLSPNDDGYSASIDVTPAFPSGMRFFSGRYVTAFVNTNGNITFSAGLPTYTPQAFPVADQPMIAPYWADVDIRPPEQQCGGFQDGFGPGDRGCRNPTHNGVWWYLEPGRMVVTWDHVGYFRCHDDKIMNFQLELLDASACGAAGDFDVEFRYNACGWTTGDASMGMGGLGGTPAQAGFDAGDSIHFFAIPGSLAPDVNTQLCTMSNVGIPGVWHFEIRNGAINTNPGTQTCGVGACRRVVPMCSNGNLVPCTPGAPTAERCDGMDHNCNGIPNDGQIECGVGVCHRVVPLCNGNQPNQCIPGTPTPERCNGVDDDCDGVVDDGCTTANPDAAAPDATDVASECYDWRCNPSLRLEGRAGPTGNCECRAAGRNGGRGQRPSRGLWTALAALLYLGVKRARSRTL